MSTYYTQPREPRDRSRTAAAKARTQHMRAMRALKYAGGAL